MPISIEQYINNKRSHKYVGLLHKIINTIKDKFPDAQVYAIPRYIAFRRQYNFASLWLKKDAVYVETKRPKKPGLIGENIPDKYQYTLNYRMIITDSIKIDSMLHVVQESYSQTR